MKFSLRLPLIATTLAALVSARAADPVLPPNAFDGIRLRGIGPARFPGRVQDIAMDPKNSAVWYIATASSGLWKTANHGVTFQPIFDKGGSYSLGTVTVDPKDSDVVWLGTGENQSLRSVSFGDGIYKSTDGGETWKRMGLEHSEHIQRILIDPRDSKVVYVAAQGPLWAPGGDRGLYKTTDGGETWKAVLTISENTGVTEVVMDSRNPDVLYASSYQRRRNVGMLIGGGPEAGIFKSEDAGATWKRETNGLPTVDLGRIALAISPVNPDYVYAHVTAARGQSGFFKSTDRGETWVLQSRYAVADPQYYGEMYCDPHVLDKVYVIDTVTGLTTDGGKTINRVGWRVHVDHHALTFDPNDSNHLLTGNDGGLYESFDNGASWHSFNNLPSAQFYGLDVDNDAPFYHIYAGAQDNGSVGGPSRTANRDGIHTSDWGDFGGGDGMQPRVDPTDPTIVYTQSQNAAFSRTDTTTGTNGGARPRGAARFNWDAPLIVSPHSHTRLYLAGNRVFRSDDKGDTWRAISPDLTRQLDRNTIPIMGRLWDSNAVTRNTYTTDLGVCTAICESRLQEGLIFYGSDDGLIQVTTDGGSNWQKFDTFPGVPDMTTVSDVQASRHDTNTVYAAFNNYQRGDFKPYLLKSTDQGRTWNSIAGNLPDRYFVWAVLEDSVNSNLLFAGTEFGLFATVDGGQHWSQFTDGVPTIAFRHLEVQEQMSDLVCATFGRGIFILDDYSPLRGLTPAVLEGDGALLPARNEYEYHEVGYMAAAPNNYVMPNPAFGSELTYYVGTGLAKDGSRLTLTVTDADGKEVRRLDAGGSAGLHRVNWDLRGPAPAGGGRGGGRGDDEDEIASMSAEDRAEAKAEAEERELEDEMAQPDSDQELQQETAATGGGTNNEAGARAETDRGGQQGADRGGDGEANRAGGRGDAAARGGGRGRRGGGGGGGFGGRGGGRQAPLVKPGKYTVTLNKTEDGKLTPVGQPQTIEVMALPSAADAKK